MTRTSTSREVKTGQSVDLIGENLSPLRKVGIYDHQCLKLKAKSDEDDSDDDSFLYVGVLDYKSESLAS